MFPRYRRYIIQQLAWSALLITVSLTSIAWLTQALRFIDFIVNRGVSLGTFLHLSSLLIPSLVLLLLPIAFFIATLFVYNRLNGDNELVVLSSAGLSRWQLAQPVVVVGAVCMSICFAISLYLLPVTYRQFKDMQAFLRDNYASLLLQEEVFNTPLPGLTVFIRSREGDGSLHGLLVHDSRDPVRPATMMAEKGELVQTPEGPRFLLENGNRQEMQRGRLSLLHFDRYTMDLSFYTNEAAKRVREPEERFINDLFNPVDVKPQAIPKMRAEAHQRLTWPLYALALPLFVLACLLPAEFNRRGQAKRVAFSVLGAMGMTLLAFALINIVGKYPMLAPLLYVNAAVLMLASVQWIISDRLSMPSIQARAA